MKFNKKRQIQKSIIKLFILSFIYIVGILFIPEYASADFATPFVEVNNMVGEVSEAYGWVVTMGTSLEEGDSFLVIVSTDTMEHVVLRATAEKGAVPESMLGKWGVIKAEVTSRYIKTQRNTIDKQLKILSLKSVEQRKKEFAKEYEELVANEKEARTKLSESPNLKFKTEPCTFGMLAGWIAGNKLPQLTLVDSVSDTIFKTTDEDIEPLSKLTGVRYISLSGTKITDIGLSYMAGLTNLQTLLIGDNKITDSGVAYLEDLRNLRELWLRGTSITDNGVKYLKDLPRLQYLDIGRNNLTDKSLTYIKDIGSLESLDINSTNITDDGIVLLKDMKNLQYINLYNTKTTRQGRVELGKAIPGLKINVEAPPREE